MDGEEQGSPNLLVVADFDTSFELLLGTLITIYAFSDQDGLQSCVPEDDASGEQAKDDSTKNLS